MPVTPIYSTTQEHLDVDDVRDDVVLLKDGSASMVLQVSSVNFGLLSEEEQDATIYSYAALLNSLTFPVQILVRSQKKDVSHYVKLLLDQEQKQTNMLLKARVKSYRAFVEKTVKEGKVLDKNFFVVIPFSHLELGLSGAVKTTLPLQKKETPRLPKEYLIKKALTALTPKRDHLFRQFARLGLKARQLKTKELVEFLFSIYNPNVKTTPSFASGKDYAAPLVQAAVAAPPTKPPAVSPPPNPKA